MSSLYQLPSDIEIAREPIISEIKYYLPHKTDAIYIYIIYLYSICKKNEAHRQGQYCN